MQILMLFYCIYTSSSNTKGKVYHAVILDNLTSPWREYMSLFDIGRSELCKFIMWGGDPIVKCNNGTETLVDISKIEQKCPDISLDRVDVLLESNAKGLPDLSLEFNEWLKKNFNLSQLQGIYAAAKGTSDAIARRGKSDHNLVDAGESHVPFTLIQGPPGTGEWIALFTI